MEDQNSLKANQIRDLLSDLEEADDMDIAFHIGLLRELPGPVSWIKVLVLWLTAANNEDIEGHIGSLKGLQTMLDRHLPDPSTRAVPTSLLKRLVNQMVGLIDIMKGEENSFIRTTVIQEAGLSKAAFEAILAHRPDDGGNPLADAQVILCLMRERDGLATETDFRLLKIKAVNALETAITIISGEHENV